MQNADLDQILFLLIQPHLFILNSAFRNLYLGTGGEEG
jgi:hypothetical protein